MTSKGKGRATEQTPLLDGEPIESYESTSADPVSAEAQSPPVEPRQSIWPILRTVFLYTLSICLLLIGILALLAWSYAHQVSKVSSDSMLDQAVVVKGPDSFDVINMTETGDLWLRVGGRIGVDAGAVVGVHDDRGNDGFFTLVWKSLGRWGIRRLGKVSVALDPFNITSLHRSGLPTLATITAVPIEAPLSDDPQPGDSWLTPMTTLVSITPTNNSQDLLEFAKDTWRSGVAMLGTTLPLVSVHGGGIQDSTWRSSMVSRTLTNVQKTFGLSSEYSLQLCNVRILTRNSPSYSWISATWKTRSFPGHCRASHPGVVCNLNHRRCPLLTRASHSRQPDP